MDGCSLIPDESHSHNVKQNLSDSLKSLFFMLYAHPDPEGIACLWIRYLGDNPTLKKVARLMAA